MTPRQQRAYDNEIDLAVALLASGHGAAAMPHLERAHVIGQLSVRAHVHSHVLMLRAAWMQRDLRGVLGQAVRVVLGALGSALGRVPTGNTGGTDVSMFRSMPLDPALAELMAGKE